MSSFLFLHFCDDALRLLGLYFSAFHPFKTFLRWFLPPPSKPPRGPHTASTGRVRSFPGVVPLPGPQNRTQGCTGPSFGFLSRTSLPLPLKGEGLVFVQFWVVLVCWTRPQRPHTAPTARVWGLAGVPHLYPVPKSAHRAAQGRVWFSPAYWRFSGGFSSLSAIPYKNSGRRKKYLCPTFLKWNQLSPSSHASVSSNPVG